MKIGEGDFAFYVSQGRLIENGKLTSPIKDVNIMGNGPKMLTNITMAANDLEMYPTEEPDNAVKTVRVFRYHSECPPALSNH